MQLLITLLVFLFIIYLLYRKKIFVNSSISSKLITLIFVIKFLFISGFVYYAKHYNQQIIPDHFDYLRNSEQLANIWKNHPKDYLKLMANIPIDEKKELKYLGSTRYWYNTNVVYNDAKTVLKIQSIFSIITFQNHSLQLLLIAFISLSSFVLITSAFSRFISQQNLFFIGLTLLSPVALAYNGLVMKEYLLILGIACFSYGWQNKKHKVWIFVFGIILLLAIKYYVLFFLLLASSFYWLLTKIIALKGRIVLFLSVFTLGIMLLFTPIGTKVTHTLTLKQYAFQNEATKGLYLYDQGIITHFYYMEEMSETNMRKINAKQILIRKDINAYRVGNKDHQKKDKVILKKGQIFDIAMVIKKPSTSYIEPLFINESKLRLLEVIPISIARTLYLPTFFSPGSHLIYVGVAESLLFMSLLGFSLIYALFYNRSTFAQPTVISIIIFILGICTLVGITTPIIGALVRYRIPAYIFIVILSFILIEPIWKRKQSLSREQHQE